MKRTVFSLLAAFALCVSAAAVGPAVSCPSAVDGKADRHGALRAG